MFDFVVGLVSGASIGFLILAGVINKKFYPKGSVNQTTWCDDNCKKCDYTDCCIFKEGKNE
jgi:hypothetical protein